MYSGEHPANSSRADFALIFTLANGFSHAWRWLSNRLLWFGVPP
jgi:hypothetical protein